MAGFPRTEQALRTQTGETVLPLLPLASSWPVMSLGVKLRKLQHALPRLASDWLDRPWGPMAGNTIPPTSTIGLHRARESLESYSQKAVPHLAWLTTAVLDIPWGVLLGKQKPLLQWLALVCQGREVVSPHPWLASPGLAMTKGARMWKLCPFFHD